jgi:hypothetical protein
MQNGLVVTDDNGSKPLSENNMTNSIFGNGITSRNEIKKMAMLFRNGS